jgi:uncharacterized caspase-like protein
VARRGHETKITRKLSEPAALVAAWLLMALPHCSLAQGEPARIALVLGSSHYEGGTWLPLRNPANDAMAISRALRTLRFQIVGCGGETGPCLDATRARMDSVIRDFGRKLREHPGALAFVYYSGHGVQARRTPDSADENFLIPVASGIEEEFELSSKAIPLQQILDTLNAVGVRSGIVVLDACRDNALKRTGKSSASKGLAPSEAGGLLIAYAAEPGHIALDAVPGGSAQLSPYARRLAEQLVLPKSIVDVFLDAGQQVAADTGGQQKPEQVIRLTQNLYLAGSSRPSEQQPPAAEPPRVVEPRPVVEPTRALEPPRRFDPAPRSSPDGCDPPASAQLRGARAPAKSR